MVSGPGGVAAEEPPAPMVDDIIYGNEVKIKRREALGEQEMWYGRADRGAGTAR